jgi:zinc/manganese transport system ATP-binding protein
MTDAQAEFTLPILKVSGLTVYQNSYLAVRDVSFELLAGTDTAIVGPNGAGKSTLIKAILDLIANVGKDGINWIHSGTIYWKDFINE